MLNSCHLFFAIAEDLLYDQEESLSKVVQGYERTVYECKANIERTR